MKKFLVIILLVISLNSSVLAQQVEVIKFEGLEEIMNNPGEKVLVLNFWATWCKPCIIEMPYFEEASAKYKDNINLIFVSLDFADQLENKVKPFLQKREIKSRVVLLDDIDYNSWIDKVDPRWSGALPATIIIDGRDNEKYFYEKEFEKEELYQILETIINKT